MISNLTPITGDNKRMLDMIMYLRGTFFDCGLITEEEYAMLASDNTYLDRLAQYRTEVRFIEARKYNV